MEDLRVLPPSSTNGVRNPGEQPIGSSTPQKGSRFLFKIIFVIVSIAGITVTGYALFFVAGLGISENKRVITHETNSLKYVDIPIKIIGDQIVETPIEALPHQLQITVLLDAPIAANYRLMCQLYERVDAKSYRNILTLSQPTKKVSLLPGPQTILVKFPVRKISEQKLTATQFDISGESSSYSTDGPYTVQCALENFSLADFNRYRFGEGLYRSFLTKPSMYMMYEGGVYTISQTPPDKEVSAYGKGDFYSNILLYETQAYKKTEFARK